MILQILHIDRLQVNCHENERDDSLQLHHLARKKHCRNVRAIYYLILV